MNTKIFLYKSLSILVGFALLINTVVYAMPTDTSALRSPSTAVTAVATGGERVKAGSAGKIKLAVILAGALALSSISNATVTAGKYGDYNDNQIKSKLHQAVTNVQIQQLIRDLNDKSINVRIRAAQTLGRIGPAAKAAIPALTRALGDPNKRVSEYAKEALKKIQQKIQKTADDEKIKQLIRDLDSKNNISTRKKAAETLYLEDINNIIPAVNILVPTLIKELRKTDNDIVIRIYAEKILGNIGPAAKNAAPYLREALRDKETGIREYAAEALGNIGPVTDEVIPALLKALGDTHPNVQRRAFKALSKHGIRTNADVIRYFEKAAAPAVTKARKALMSTNVGVRRLASWDIGNIGWPARVAVPDLIEALKDGDVDVRINAAWALGRIGPVAGVTAVYALTKALNDPNDTVCKYARQSLDIILGTIDMQRPRSKKKSDDQGSLMIPFVNPLHAKSSASGTLNLDNVSTLTDNNLAKAINIARQQGDTDLANILLQSLLSSELIKLNPRLAREFAKLEKNAVVGIDDTTLPDNHLFRTYLKVGTEQHEALEEIHGCTIRLLSELTADDIAGKKLIIMSDKTKIEGYEKALYMHMNKQKVEAGLLLSPYIGIAKLLLIVREDILVDIVNALNKNGLYHMLFGRPANVKEIREFLISGIYELPTPTIVNYQSDEEKHRASLAALIAA